MSVEDQAQVLEAHLWEMNNRRRAVKTFKPDEAGYGPKECEDCGDDMPTVRRELGACRCVTCQNELDKRRRLLGAEA
jgi:RNA polymerase-binding transcription factor DksA